MMKFLLLFCITDPFPALLFASRLPAFAGPCLEPCGGCWFAPHIAGIWRDRGSPWPHSPGPIRAPAVRPGGAFGLVVLFPAGGRRRACGGVPVAMAPGPCWLAPVVLVAPAQCARGRCWVGEPRPPSPVRAWARAPGAPPGTTPPAQRRRRGADRAGGMGPRGTPIAPNSCNVRGKPAAAAGFQTRASKGRQTGSKKQGREGVSNTEKKKKISSYKKNPVCPRFVPALSPFCPRLPIGLKPA